MQDSALHAGAPGKGAVRIPACDIGAGESKKVSIVCPVKELAWYNPQTGDWEVEKMVYEGYIGTSSSERDLLRGSFTLN